MHPTAYLEELALGAAGDVYRGGDAHAPVAELVQRLAVGVDFGVVGEAFGPAARLGALDKVDFAGGGGRKRRNPERVPRIKFAQVERPVAVADVLDDLGLVEFEGVAGEPHRPDFRFRQ